MTWLERLLLVLAVWFAVSILIGIFVGKVIVFGERE